MTIREIAKEAGVSIATVSRFMNRSYGSMSAETRKRLQEIVDRSGYTGRNAKQRPSVALVFPTVSDPFFAALLEQLSIAISENGFDLQLCLTMDSVKAETQCISRLTASAVSGILYLSTVTDDGNCYDLLRKGSKPYVVLDSYLPDYNLASLVVTDGMHGMYDATRYLLDNGHTGIAYLSGLQSSKFEHYRYQGYLQALLEAKLSVRPRLIQRSGFCFEDGMTGLDALLASGEKFSAVLCESDMVAAGVYKRASERGIGIPGQLSVIGFNNSFVSRVLSPSLTSVDQQLDRIAGQALLQLVKQMNGCPLSERTILIPSRLTIRDSVRAFTG